jgi:hypothetical protein
MPLGRLLLLGHVLGSVLFGGQQPRSFKHRLQLAAVSQFLTYASPLILVEEPLQRPFWKTIKL